MGARRVLNPAWWFDSEPRAGWQQMAIDRALAERAAIDGTIVYRLYRWAGHTVSFGANEAALRTWDRERLAGHEIPCVRRPTGGRGVWHDASDLTYAVTAPSVALGGLRLAYRSIHEQLAASLESLGLPAAVAASDRRAATLEPGACFESAVGGEVLVAGRKTIGSAQAVFGPAMLQHGAIALADRRPRLARFRLGSAETGAPDTPDALPPAQAVADAIVAGWSNAGIMPVPAATIEWVEAHCVAYADRFRDLEWTWRR